MYKIAFFLFFGISVFFLEPFSSAAVIIDNDFDIQKLINKKLGYFIASFDPIHKGHQHVIQEALKKNYVDFILVYPLSNKDQNSLTLPQEMLEFLYAENPKILFTYLNPKELQDIFKAFSEKIEITGIIGSDFIKEKLFDKESKIFMRGIPLAKEHYEDATGAMMALNATSFLVASKGNIDFYFLNKKIFDRPIKAFIESNEYSSTDIRNAIIANRPFEHMVDFTIQAIIKEKELYGFKQNLNKQLQKELLDMQEEDQAPRKTSNNNDFYQDLTKIAEKHNLQLKEIIKKYGWPGISLVGYEGTYAMWLLVQHQDLDLEFQKQCLDLLKNAVERYESSFQNYAYLIDRVRTHQKLPQIYGTQWDKIDGKLTLYTVEDIENLDKRRFQIGLCSIEKYKKRMKEAYHLTDKDFK